MKILKPIILAAGVAIALGAAIPARADTFTTGEFVSYTQADWNSDAPASTLLQNYFEYVYAPNGFSLDVGIGLSISFDSASAVQAYIPTPGTAGVLTSDQLDPNVTAAGIFGGSVTALALDVDFSAYGALHGTSSTPFGNLRITGFNPNSEYFDLDGMSVSAFLVVVETALGGGSTDGYTIADLDLIAAQITDGFEDGNVSQFANDHLEGPDIETTPLPGALPLFAGGLGALGLLLRRTKPKRPALTA